MERAQKQEESKEIEALIAQFAASPKRIARRLRDAEKRLALYEEERRLERAKRFGASADRNEDQFRLFNEAETHENDTEEDSDNADETLGVDQIDVVAHRKRKPKRKPLPKNLPRVVIDHTLSDDQRQCDCGCELKSIGVQTSEQLDVIPARAYVVEHRRHSYRCSGCDAPPKTAPLTPQPLPKSIAGPGLLAHVATAKYVDGMPLYRQSSMFKRHGVHLPRQTMASHMVKVGELVTPLVKRLHAALLSYDVLQMDETPVQVLKEPGKTAQSKSYMWVMKGGPPGKPGVIYHYAPSRGGTVAAALLKNYAGYLQTDGYAGYREVCRSKDIIGLGCLAHARRKFTDASKALSKNAQQKKSTRVHKALTFIERLYQVERGQKNATADERLLARQTLARPVLHRFKAWLDRQSIPPQSLLGKAISYTLNEWPRLIVYLEDGRLNVDNNLVENAIRPFAVGRKSWLFSASQAGATASANLYSLVCSARANGLNEYAYLKYVFTHLPAIHCDEDLDALLPWNLTDARLKPMLSMPVVSTT